MSQTIRTMVPRHQPDHHVERVNAEVLLCLPDQSKAIFLNHTAALLWDLCDGQRSVADIVGLLGAAFPQDRGQVARDIQDALRLLEEHGALVLL